jgi:hypothetical protein
MFDATGAASSSNGMANLRPMPKNGGSLIYGVLSPDKN